MWRELQAELYFSPPEPYYSYISNQYQVHFSGVLKDANMPMFDFVDLIKPGTPFIYSLDYPINLSIFRAKLDK